MAEHKTKGGHMSADIPASALPFPEALLRPGAGTVVPEPRDAAPRVPNLACPKCGEPDTTMRFCNGEWTLHWGSCDAKQDGEHFHRGCPRCTCRWTTCDVLDAQ